MVDGYAAVASAVPMADDTITKKNERIIVYKRQENARSTFDARTHAQQST